MNEIAIELADIIDPAPAAAAAGPGITWLVACVMLLALAFACAVWWRRTSTRRRALRRMRRLRRDVARGGIGARDLAYRVAGELQASMRTARLRASAAPGAESAARQREWREFVARLDALRYRPGAQLDTAQLRRLLHDGTHWLRRAR